DKNEYVIAFLIQQSQHRERSEVRRHGEPVRLSRGLESILSLEQPAYQYACVPAIKAITLLSMTVSCVTAGVG
ncbi:MAG: hypothetical protein ACPIOQ_60670, partial [Promethearchaeia archaeon]